MKSQIRQKQSTRRTFFQIALLGTFSMVMLHSESVIADDFAGTLKEVTITDTLSTNTPPQAIFTFSIQDTNVQFDASNSNDTDGYVTEYHWDFGDGTTATGVQVSHQYTDRTNKAVTLTVIDDGNAASLLQQQIIFQKPVDIAINFQPADAETPPGYQPDSGAIYADSRGYGWVNPAYEAFFDRNSKNAPDQSYDTLVNVLKDAVWEISIPNGLYTVTILVGDPDYPYAHNNIQIEDMNIITNELTSINGSYFIKKTFDINVLDGKMTFTFKNSIPKTKLCSISIKTNDEK